MTESILVEIIRSCLEMDRMAEDAYLRLAAGEAGPELAAFWQAMAVEEKGHVAFWEALLDFARQGRLPDLFADPVSTLEALAVTAREVRGLLSRADHPGGPGQAFVLCYRLEAALMHPAFEALFRFAQDSRLPLPLENPADDYARHIRFFVESLGRFGGLSPEVMLIGELLTRLHEESKALAVGAHTDELTGVLNRRGFFMVVDPLVFLCARKAEPAGLAVLDVDGLGRINRIHGQRLGDMVLASVAACVREALGGRDILGRLGDDSFGVFLPGCGPQGLEAFACRAAQSVESLAHHGVSVTVSVAAAALPQGPGMAEVERAVGELEDKLRSGAAGAC